MAGGIHVLTPCHTYIPVHHFATKTTLITPFFLVYEAPLNVTEPVTYLFIENLPKGAPRRGIFDGCRPDAPGGGLGLAICHRAASYRQRSVSRRLSLWGQLPNYHKGFLNLRVMRSDSPIAIISEVPSELRSLPARVGGSRHTVSSSVGASFLLEL